MTQRETLRETLQKLRNETSDSYESLQEFYEGVCAALAAPETPGHEYDFTTGEHKEEDVCPGCLAGTPMPDGETPSAIDGPFGITITELEQLVLAKVRAWKLNPNNDNHRVLHESAAQWIAATGEPQEILKLMPSKETPSAGVSEEQVRQAITDYYRSANLATETLSKFIADRLNALHRAPLAAKEDAK